MHKTCRETRWGMNPAQSWMSFWNVWIHSVSRRSHWRFWAEQWLLLFRKMSTMVMVASWSCIREWWERVLESFRREYWLVNWQWEQQEVMSLPFVVQADSKGFGLRGDCGVWGRWEVKVGPRGSCKRPCGPAILFGLPRFCFVPHWAGCVLSLVAK